MKGMLEGIRVLDITQNIAGPCTTATMGDFGAEIIKIERPKYGDDCRGYAPNVEGDSMSHWWGNRGKKSVTLDLTDPEAIDVIKKIIADVDVLVESFRPGVMAKSGLDYDSVVKIKPDIIYCSVTAYGQYGPYAKKPGYDLIAQALSGLMYITGEPDGPPTKHGIAIGDFMGAEAAYSAVVTALFHRLRTGEGQYIDVSLLRNLIHVNSAIDRVSVGVYTHRVGNHHTGLAPYGVFNGKNDQSVVLGAVNPKMWGNVCTLIGRPDLIDHPDYNTVFKRCQVSGEIIALIEEWLKKFDNIDDALALMQEADIACCKVNSIKDVVEDPHVKAVGWLAEVETPDNITTLDKYLTRPTHVGFLQRPGAIRKAPSLGQHNYEVLGKYGWSKEKIDALQSKWNS